MQVVTTEFSARFLFESLMLESRERAAELTRECLQFKQQITAGYYEEQCVAIHNIRRLAMEVLDMIEANVYDENRIKQIRAYFPNVRS